MTLSSWTQVLGCLTLGFSVCWALTRVILQRAEGGKLARAKDFHHGHKEAIPRLGGLGFVTAFLVVALFVYFCTNMLPKDASTLWVIAGNSLAMFALGFWDDIRPLSAKFKLLAQIAIASSVYWGNIRIELFEDPFTDSDFHLGLLGYFATVFWLISLTNLINLIDGIDGLAGGIGLMLMLLMANLGMSDNLNYSMLLSIGVAGALIGFLKYNYPPAKIYMGDGGAYFLGFLIGTLSIVNSNKGDVAAALIAPAFALALPIVDVSLALVRRGLRGLPLFRPDQKHIHHRLITLGISRERTLLNLYTVSLLCLFLALGLFCLQGRLLPLYTGLLFLVLLVAGQLSGFTRNWFKIPSQMGQLLSLRKETRYALSLDRWLVLAAERDASLETLWEDYRFMVRKLGFIKVTLTLPDLTKRSWQAERFDMNSLNYQSTSHEISDGTVIEFTADKRVMPEVVFMLLGDLAAETWYKAAAKCWRATGCVRIPAPSGDYANNRPGANVSFANESPAMLAE